MRRRHAVLGAGALLAGLSGCSKTDTAAPAPPPAPDAGPRQVFDTAARGTGFVVGQAMAARELRVFFDPQCPHCAALWIAGKPLLDRAVRMVWMPVAFISPASGPQGSLLLAAQDPASTMDRHEALLSSGAGGLAVAGPADAGLLEKVKANTEIWRVLNAESVPYLVYRRGSDGPFGVHAGALSTPELAQLLGL